MSNKDWRKDVVKFECEAMASVFEFYINHEDQQYAKSAAYEASRTLAALENDLSRYVENSDISQINNLSAGQKVVVSLHAFECLKVSKKVYELSDGYFDISVDKDLKPIRKDDSRDSLFDNLILNEEDFTVEVLSDNIAIDLGGIGKGYAVEVMAGQLREWDIESFLIHGGYSSVTAFGKVDELRGWPVRITDIAGSVDAYYAYLDGFSLSSSGLRKGGHIINPFTSTPLEGKKAVWVCARDAVVADALSTAFMIMSNEDIKRICNSEYDILAILCDKDKNQTVMYGDWSQVGLRNSES